MTGVRFLAAVATLAGLAAAQISITSSPPSPYDLAPAQVTDVKVTVTIPGESRLEQADVYILADVTASMTPTIQAVQTAAEAVVQALYRMPLNMRIGIGQYRDYPGVVFTHLQSPTENGAAVIAAIRTWSASGGGDLDEGQFVALSQVATDPTIGFRPGAKRILVWFGDAPAHDPVCPAMDPSLPFSVTEDTTIQALVASGPGGTTVIAISSPTGVPGALNADPRTSVAYYRDYSSFCPIGGFAGQAGRIATATGGIDLTLVNPQQIVEAILNSVRDALSVVDVSLGFVPVTPGFDTFVTAVTPPLHGDVRIPNSPRESVTVNFTVRLTGQNCIENRREFLGRVQVLFDGARAGRPVDVRITQSPCAVVGLHILGATQTNITLPAWFPGGPDVLLTMPLAQAPAAPNGVPSVPIPNDPILLGMSLFSQIVLYNPVNYPSDWLKLSNGVQITIGGSVVEYGSDLDIKHWCSSEPALGGTLEFGFLVQ